MPSIIAVKNFKEHPDIPPNAPNLAPEQVMS
jgi:hypothetical protein